jgi:hypothetical protein
MLNIKLFIGGERVDFFEDESIQLTDSIQDARDAGKIFTAVSSDFTVPASVINNNIFKHFYSFDIIDGFDPREKVKASLLQNGFLYKKGYVQIRSVNMEKNKAASYKIFFTGLLGELKDIFKGDKLSDLLQLNQYSHPYNAATIRAGLQSYFDVSSNLPDFSFPNNKDMCYPFVSSVNRYAFGASGLRTVDNETGTITNSKIQTSDLKPALRAIRIIEAIEEKYNITFDSDFLKTNAIFTELYLWLNRSKGVLADDTRFDVIFFITSFDFVDGNEVLNLSSETIQTERLLNGQGSLDFITFNFEYKITVTGSGQISARILDANTNQTFGRFSQNVEDQTISVSAKFESLNERSDTYRPVIIISTESADITNIDVDLVVNKEANQDAQPFNQTGNYESSDGEIAATSDVNVTLQVPSMLVLDFLTSIFKTFNLTAFIKNDGTISVQTLDAFYAAGKTIDITNQIDISKSQVKRFEPYKEINFDFEKADSFLMINREKILDDVYGNLNYQVSSDDPEKLIGGGNYDIKPKFFKILPERLRRNNGDPSSIMYALYVNEDFEPLSNQPILFYTKRNTFTASTAIQFENGTNLTSNIAPSNVKEDLSQTINFGSEIDEFTLQVNEQSLFENFYKTFIRRSFSSRSKILKVNAKLNADFILNYALNDEFIINNRKFNINSIDIDLGTGESSIELRNVFNILSIAGPDTPVANQLTISIPNQSQNDASGSYSLGVFSNVTFTVSDDAAFISVTPTSGTNSTLLTINYAENTSTETRSGVVTVTGGGITREHTLTQTGKVVELTIDIATKTVTTPAGTYNLGITSNSNWNISDNQPWSSQSPTSGTGDATINIAYDENLSAEGRVSIIQVVAGDITRTHTLTQNAQNTSQLFPRVASVRRAYKASACATNAEQTYYADSLIFTDITIMFFDENGINRVSAGFYASGTDVLQTNNNGEVINVLTC